MGDGTCHTSSSDGPLISIEWPSWQPIRVTLGCTIVSRLYLWSVYRTYNEVSIVFRHVYSAAALSFRTL